MTKSTLKADKTKPQKSANKKVGETKTAKRGGAELTEFVDPIKKGPGFKIEMRLVSELVPNAKNARTHSEAQVDELCASYGEWGWTNPILIDEENGIIAGHGRRLMAIKKKLKSVPVIVADGWSEAQKRAYIIADNKLAMNAGWDLEVLGGELIDLKALGFDLALTGFSLGEIGELTLGASGGLTDADDVPDALPKPVSIFGDIWLLGDHRLACGSSTDAETVTAVLGGQAPHLMVTDPPYGVEYDASWREKAGLNGPKAAKGKVMNDNRADWSEAWALFPGDVAYVWHADLHAKTVVDSLEACGFFIRSQIIWAKSSLVMGRGDYHYQHEPCWYAVRKGKNGQYRGGRKQSTLWQIDKPKKSETGHSTQKPVECMKRPIENNSKVGDCVYEPFSGSGTTIIAAEMTGRHCFAIELNPTYVDMAVMRWQAFTGRAATLQGTAQAFDEIMAQRQGGKR